MQANERNSCQHCWRSSKEAIHSGTVILADVFTRPTLLWFHALRFAGHRTMEMLGLVAKKSLTGLKLYAKSANNYQQSPTLLWYHANGRNILEHVRPNNVACCWPTLLHRLYGPKHRRKSKENKWTDTDAKKLAFCAFLQKWGKPHCKTLLP